MRSMSTSAMIYVRQLLACDNTRWAAMRAGVVVGNNGLVGRRNNLTGRNERRRDGFCTGHPTGNEQIRCDYTPLQCIRGC
jgi:hypothetical protein